jgi:hypothetical protein
VKTLIENGWGILLDLEVQGITCFALCMMNCTLSESLP